MHVILPTGLWPLADEKDIIFVTKMEKEYRQQLLDLSKSDAEKEKKEAPVTKEELS